MMNSTVEEGKMKNIEKNDLHRGTLHRKIYTYSAHAAAPQKKRASNNNEKNYRNYTVCCATQCTSTELMQQQKQYQNC